MVRRALAISFLGLTLGLFHAISEGSVFAEGVRPDSDQDHWAFRPIIEPETPGPGDGSQADSAIDAFIRARLEPKGLRLSARAGKRTLIRRASFDLTGLPPAFEEVEAFLRDSEPAAFDRLVGRLLASPRFGERWGRHWLDVARYADTKGYVFNEGRFFPYSHTYRDYVIRAFNEDLPYDRFIEEQLAADLLDLGEDKRALAALGFLTLGRRFLNNINDITDDRIDVVTRGLMGLTVSCARCHDHKYDPISMADYYGLYGVFRSSYEPEDLPLIEDPDPNDENYQAYQAAVAKAKGELESFVSQRHVEALTEARDRSAGYLLAAFDAREMSEDREVQTLARDRKLQWRLIKRWKAYLAQQEEEHDPVFAPWFAYASIEDEDFQGRVGELSRRFQKRGERVGKTSNRIASLLSEKPPMSMKELAARYGEAFAEADEAWKNLLAAQVQIALAESDRAFAMPESLADADLEALRATLYGSDSPGMISRGEIEQFLTTKNIEAITRRRVAVQNVESTHVGRPDRAMALFDLEEPFEPHVFLRGQPGAQGGIVPRAFLTVLSPPERVPFQEGSGRLELARAIADRGNPLTARVFVNRVWLHLFGRGLVDTPSDFGFRSDPPSHPELLDYLAATFMERGWSIKSLLREIMLSSTYQQSAFASAEGLELDPENRLLSRQNRRRLDFESMHDSLLSVAGTLDATMGGPGVAARSGKYSKRRAVYGQIERQNLPSQFRIFDFANPDAHSSRRFETTVPQQALFALNSSFVVEQARAIASSANDGASGNAADGIREMYRSVFQREPTRDEIGTARSFLLDQGEAAGPEPPPQSPWEYGYGAVVPYPELSVTFHTLSVYTRERWQIGKTMPDPELGWASLSRVGGHPGNTPARASIRRFRAPEPGVYSVSGALRHRQDRGDGIAGAIISSRTGLVWHDTVFNGSASAAAQNLHLEAGDTIDFVVSCRANEGFDSYQWAPVVLLEQAEEAFDETKGRVARWNSRSGFSGPPPKMPEPLNAWEQYAHVLLMSNEFWFID